MVSLYLCCADWVWYQQTWSEEEELEDTKGVIRIRKTKDRQHNGQKKKDKRTNNYLQNMTQKTKDRVTRTPIKNRRWTYLSYATRAVKSKPHCDNSIPKTTLPCPCLMLINPIVYVYLQLQNQVHDTLRPECLSRESINQQITLK
jgi:hypothetical protein